MSNAIRYREANLLDVPEIARLCADSHLEEGYWRARLTGYMKLEFNPHQATSQRLIYVAVHKGVVIGFVAGHLTKRQEYAGQIQWIATDAQWRRTGVGSELLWIMAGWFVENQVASVRVDLDPDNNTAQSFYQHHHAASINRYWLYWDDIGIVHTDRGPSGKQSGKKADI